MTDSSKRAALSVTVLSALALPACAQNAILELEVELPAAPVGETWFGHVQARPGSSAFTPPWTEVDVDPVELGAAPQWDCISVVSAEAGTDLNVRVRFCGVADCLDLAGDETPPERRFRIEQPFYIGRRTYHRLMIPDVPDCLLDADCAGFGRCVGGACGGCTSDTDCGAGRSCESAGCVEVVDRCSVAGCVEGPLVLSYCTADGGPHYCEEHATVGRDLVCGAP